MWTDLAILISKGISFQSVGAEAIKARSPIVFSPHQDYLSFMIGN